MAKKEIKTDLWVYDLLKDAELDLPLIPVFVYHVRLLFCEA